MLISGSCHCGNIRFALNWEPSPAAIPARICDCTFCSKHGAAWTSLPTAELAIEISDPTHVSRYAFGTETADFHICMRCGGVPVVTSMIGQRIYAVVNVNMFENVPPSMLRRSPATLGEESGDERLDRRQRNWISNVRLVEATHPPHLER